MFRTSRKFLASLSSSYSFGSVSKRWKEFACIDRTKIANYSREVFQANIELFYEGSPKASVLTNTQILQNMNYLSIENTKLHKIIKKTIEEKIDQEITPRVALETLFSICPSLEGDEAALLKKLSEYFKKFYYLFEYQELASAEYTYMKSAKYLVLPFNSSLENEVAFLKQKEKSLIQVNTNHLLEQLKVKPLKGVNAVFTKAEDKVQISFHHQNQILTILGLQHGDYKGIYQLKEYLLKNKSTKHFIVELPPLFDYQYSDLMDEIETGRDEKLKSILFGGKIFSGNDISSSSTPEEKLKHFKEIPVLQGDMARFYINKFILQQKNQFRLSETEGIIYSDEDGLAVPNEFLSFIYHLMNKDKNKESTILLADMPLEEEIFHQIQGKTNEQVQEQINRMKLVNLNEQINWAIRVAKSGCPACTKSIKRGPLDIIHACGQTDYDFSIRQKHIAKQALNFMKINKDEEKFLMIVDNRNLQPLLKEILEQHTKMEQDSGFSGTRKQAKNLSEFIQDTNSIKQSPDFASASNDENFLIKFSQLSSFFKTNKILLPPQMRDSQNISNFKSLRNYNKEKMDMDNLVPENLRWKKQKGFDKCYALNQLKLV